MTVGGKPAFFMNGGIMELDKNNVISTIDKYLLEENLELYDINIVNFPILDTKSTPCICFNSFVSIFSKLDTFITKVLLLILDEGNLYSLQGTPRITTSDNKQAFSVDRFIFIVLFLDI